MATAASRAQSSVTLLHKGQGPSLFQYQSAPFPVSSGEKSLKPVTPSASTTPRRFVPTPQVKANPAKRIIVKCANRQDANYMFAKRLQERTARHFRPSNGEAPTPPKTAKEQEQCEFFLKERLYSNTAYKPAAFPPPSFMPRWNPRHKDRTYLSKMVLEDPWSLPAEKRIELKKRTGLRLKSLSRHYQYKVGSQLPFGKDAASKYTCYVNFCEHCSKDTPDYRCPLHMQLLDDWEPDCKTEATEFCPLAKNPEDLPLDMIQNPDIYVSEVVRRLRAGEITEPPPFPSRFLLDPKKQSILDRKKVQAEASTDALDHAEKKALEDSCTQTEPFIVDVDMKAAFKDNLCQTQRPERAEPFLLTSVLAQRQAGQQYRTWPTQSKDEILQVTPCMIESFEKRSSKVVQRLTKQTIQQALQEISDEVRIQQITRATAHFTQRLADLQRTAQFRYLQEKWRNSAYQDEHFAVEKETMHEKWGEEAICAASFCQSYFWNFPSKVLDTLRRQGFVMNEDLEAMNTVVKDELNRLIEQKMRCRDDSCKLLDEMIRHALLDLEMDSFRGKLVDAKYLNPLNWTTKFLRDLLVLQDSNLEMVRRIKERLLQSGHWIYNEDGELVYLGPGTPTPESDSSSEVSLDAFLKGVRVSMDSEGNPKYLVDATGKRLPINVRWMPVLEEQVDKHKGSANEFRFDIVLNEESLSDTQSVISGKGRKTHKFSAGKTDGAEREEEGLGLDMDYLGSEKGDSEDDPEDVGRLVFKRKDTLDDEYDDEVYYDGDDDYLM